MLPELSESALSDTDGDFDPETLRLAEKTGIAPALVEQTLNTRLSSLLTHVPTTEEAIELEGICRGKRWA